MKMKFKTWFIRLYCQTFGHNPADDTPFPDVKCLRCGGWYKREKPETVFYV